MAILTITFTSGAVMRIDDASSVRVPDGTVEAGTLSEGDLVCMFRDGTMVLEIESIE